MTHSERIKKLFLERYNSQPDVIIRAPGRINLIGEHTDYNKGFVFPAAIDKSMYFGFRRNNISTVNIVALDKNSSTSFSLNEEHTPNLLWEKYSYGVIREFQNRGIEIPGFDCLFFSEIPIGAGVSSSAALECGFAKGIDQLAASALDHWTLAKIGNGAENNYLGIKSGILDQFASVFGKQDHAMLMDCRDLSFQYYKIDLENYDFVLINTNVKHSHLSSGYNDRPAECKQVVSAFNEASILSLRDVSKDKLETVKNKLSETLYHRADFIINENRRVLDFKAALLKNDINQMGVLLTETHVGLSKKYEVSCLELDLLVTLAQKENDIVGARMMGGGFGGCTLNLVKKDCKKSVIGRIQSEYKNQTGIDSEAYYVNIADGVEVC